MAYPILPPLMTDVPAEKTGLTKGNALFQWLKTYVPKVT
jgi:hypothetical protein